MYLKYLVLIVLILIIFVLLRHYNNNENENKEGFQDAPGITWCANENGMCSVDSGSTIIYGAGIGWTHKQFPNGINVKCNNETFVDPNQSVPKKCYKVPAAYEFAAMEGSEINVTKGDTVFYGQEDTWVPTKYEEDGIIICNNATFSKDPIPGVKKMCFIQPASTPMASTTTPFVSTNTPFVSTTLPPSASTTLPPSNSTTTPFATSTLPPSASTTTPFATSTTPQNVSSTVSPSGFNFSDPTELKVLETNNFNTGSDLQFRIDGNVTETQLLMIKSFIQ